MEKANKLTLTATIVLLTLSPPVSADVLNMKDGKTIECVIVMRAAEIYGIKYLDREECKIRTRSLKASDIASVGETAESSANIMDSWKTEIAYECREFANAREAQLFFFKRLSELDRIRINIMLGFTVLFNSVNDVYEKYDLIREYEKKLAIVLSQVEKLKVPAIQKGCVSYLL